VTSPARKMLESLQNVAAAAKATSETAAKVRQGVAVEQTQQQGEVSINGRGGEPADQA